MRKERWAQNSRHEENTTKLTLYPILSIKSPKEAHRRAAIMKIELVNLEATVKLRSYLCMNMLFETLVNGKIDEYTLTQLSQISQYARGNFFRDEKSIFSSFPSRFTGNSLLWALLSKRSKIWPKMKQIQMRLSPKNRADPSESFSAITGMSRLFEVLPRRPTLMPRARTKASSLPLNHLLAKTL